MTTIHYQHDRFYADTRAYVYGQPFSIMNKIVALDEPIALKAVLDKGGVKPVVLDEVIYGYFITHAVEPGRALFRTLVAAAEEQGGDIQGVLDNFEMFIETFKLASREAHFTLTLIGETAMYSISSPSSIGESCTYDKSPYVSANDRPLQITCGANHDHFTAFIAAGYPPILAYYAVFLQYVESGGPVQVLSFVTLDGKRTLRQHQLYNEVSREKMEQALERWADEKRGEPLADLESLFTYGKNILNETMLTTAVEAMGYKLEYSDKGLVEKLTDPTNKRAPIDLVFESKPMKKRINKTKQTAATAGVKRKRASK